MLGIGWMKEGVGQQGWVGDERSGGVGVCVCGVEEPDLERSSLISFAFVGGTGQTPSRGAWKQSERVDGECERRRVGMRVRGGAWWLGDQRVRG